MRWLLIVLFLLPSTVFAENVSRVTTSALNIVQINLNSPTVDIQIVSARKGPCSVESFGSMVKRVRPVAAINGGFFCMRTLRPIGDIRTNSIGRHGCYGDDLLANGNKVHFLSRQLARQCKGNIIGLGPRLLWNGKIALDPASEKFTGKVHFAVRIRTAIAITKSNKLIFAISRRPMYLRDMAKQLLNYGCTTAYGIDGGSSSGLFYKGKFIVGPGRSIVNCIVVVKA
jgi:exopolysaccharide biosynthesis protein